MRHHQGMRLPAGVSSDHFLMFTYKIVPCPRKSAHDWIDCPYAHSGESARRREPHLYKPVPCPESKGGQPCPRGESCKYAHNDFEYWLHPSRFKTELCKQGPGCNRKVCFFAHQPEEVRKLSRSFVNDHCSAGVKKHTRRSIARSPVQTSSEQTSVLPTRMPPRRISDWGKVPNLAEAQLGEALQKLRLPQSPANLHQMGTGPMMVGMKPISSPFISEGGIACSNELSSLQMHLDSVHPGGPHCGGPPVHLHGENGFSSFDHNSWRFPKPSPPVVLNDKILSCHSHKNNFDDACAWPRNSPIAARPADGNAALSIGQMAIPSLLGRSSLDIGSPDPVGSLRGWNLQGAVAPSFGNHQHFSNPCDNGALQMNRSFTGFSGQANSNISQLFQGLGQHKLGTHMGNPASWYLRNSQMADDGPVFV